MGAAAAWAIIKRVLPYAIALAVAIGALYGAYHHGVRVTGAEWSAKWSARDAADEKARADATQAARLKEVSDAAALANLELDYQGRLKNEIDSRDALIADLRSGALRVRQRLTCAASDSGNMPGTAADTGGPAKAAGGGLRPQDAEFLLREAARADQAVNLANKCMSVLRVERGLK